MTSWQGQIVSREPLIPPAEQEPEETNGMRDK